VEERILCDQERAPTSLRDPCEGRIGPGMRTGSRTPESDAYLSSLRTAAPTHVRQNVTAGEAK
jgi:hypothetical protein